MDSEHYITHRIWIWFRALRPFSFPISVLPALIAMLLTTGETDWDWIRAIAVLVLVLSFHSAGNLLNDYFDVNQGIDTRHDDADRPGRFLLEGQITRRGVRRAIILFLCLGTAAGGYLAWCQGAVILGFVVMAFLALYAYTGPPFHIKYYAGGEALVFLVFGPLLMTGSAYALTGIFRYDVLTISLPIGCGITSILVGNNIRDMDEDRAAGITTLPLVIGRYVAQIIYGVCLLLFVGGLALLAWTDQLPLPIILAPLALAFHLPVLHSMGRGQRTPNVDAKTARFVSLVLIFVLVTIMLET